MTHLREENTAFHNAKKIKLFILFVVFPSLVYSQINLNGFGEVNQFNSISSATSLVTSYIDSDREPDYIVANSSKTITVHLSTQDYKINSINVPFEISLLRRIKKVGESETEIGFLSRRDKVFGTFIINAKGKLSKLQSTKFENNPENFVISRNTQKALVFGSNFDGIKLVDTDFNGETLDLVKGRLVRDAVFYDFDNDLNTDIVYYDIFNGTLNLIRNEINFQLTEINLSKEIKNLTRFRRADFNYDGFEDLLFSSANGIEIFQGDSISVFEQSKILIKENDVKDFQLIDLNNDGYLDIVYLKNSVTGKQLFASIMQNGKLSKPVLLSGVNSVATFDVSSWSKVKLSFSTDESKVTMMTSISKLENTFLRLGALPCRIFAFRKDSNSLLNLAIIDSIDNTLKLYTEALSKYYEFKLKNLHNNLKVSFLDNEKLLLIIFTKGRKLIEILNINLTDGSYWTRQYYTINNILDLKIDNRENNLPAIITLTDKSGSVSIEEFEYKGIRYSKSEPTIISENIKTAMFSATKKYGYIKKISDFSFELGVEFLKGSDAALANNRVVNIDTTFLTYTAVKSFGNEDDPIILYVLKTVMNSYTFIFYNTNFIKLNNTINLENIQNIIRKRDNIASMFFTVDGIINKAEIRLNTGKIPSIEEIATYKGPYIVEFINEQNQYMFMINKTSNLIELKKIE